MNQYKAFNRHDVHKWLINIPNYHENYQTNSSNEIEESSLTRKERPLSLLSLNSEDSISLDDFINANYTPSMDDEIDLLSLSSLHLDDNSEEFWKVDNIFNHYISSQLTKTKNQNDYHTTHHISSFDRDYKLVSNGTKDLHIFEESTGYSFINKLDSLSICDNTEGFNDKNSINSYFTSLNYQDTDSTVSTSTSSSSSYSMKKTNKLSLLPYFHTFSTNNSTTSIASARLSDNSNQYSYHKRSLIPSNSENIRSKNNTISNLHVNSNSLPNTQLSGSADRHKLTMTTESQNRRSISFTTTHTKSKSDLPLSTANKIPQPMRQKVTRISVSPTRSTTSLGYLSTHSYSKKPSLQYSCRESNTPTRSKTSMGALKSGIPILSRR